MDAAVVVNAVNGRSGASVAPEKAVKAAAGAQTAARAGTRPVKAPPPSPRRAKSAPAAVTARKGQSAAKVPSGVIAANVVPVVSVRPCHPLTWAPRRPTALSAQPLLRRLRPTAKAAAAVAVAAAVDATGTKLPRLKTPAAA